MSDSSMNDSPRSPLWRRIISFVLCAAVLATAAWWLLREKSQASVAIKAMPPMGPIPVQVETIEPTTVQVALEYLGQTEAFQKVEVRSRVAAFLEKRMFEEGAAVKEGQELFRLERDTFEAEVDAAKAAVAQAEARTEAGLRDVKRLEDLTAGSATTPKELDDARRDLKVAQADVQATKARHRQVQLSLDYTIIRSPLTGVVGKANRDVGSYLNPQTDGPLVLVQQVDPLYIQFPITERDLLRWRALSDSGRQKELAVELTLPDGKRYPHQGKVNFVGISVEPRTGTAVVRAKLVNPDGVLRPGQLLRVKVMGLERQNVLTVPQQAVIQTSQGAIVYVVGPKGVAQPTPVSLGEWVADRWVVEQGLQPKAQVIVDHLMQLRPGSPVQPTEAPAGAGHAGPQGSPQEGSVGHAG